LFDVITRDAVCFAVAEASVEEIEALNILGASQLAMRRAVEKLSVIPSLTLIDGNVARDFPVMTRCVVGVDGKSACVAAASILAKVVRDRIMCEWGVRYPGYGFEKHKGYPTKAHYEKIRELGVTPLHRTYFLRKFWVNWNNKPRLLWNADVRENG
jgi:ribonuclease HII